ncbi:MAG: type II toxin-antitoxin system VapC family toxin [Bacteroidota bacterium]
MRLLLDTHAFLWFIGGNERLSRSAREAILDRESERFVSIASLWEMSIKAGLGRLDVPRPFERLLREHVIGNAMEVLPIRPLHLDVLTDLTQHHRDPFDRLILAQATVERLTIVSRDAEFERYGVPLLTA